MQPLSKTAIAGLSAASTIAAVHAARQAAASSSPARSSDIPRGTPSPVPAIALQPPSLSSSNAAVGGPDGGGDAINYVSSSDSSSPLSETYRPANECPASMADGAIAAAEAASSKRSASDQKNCFKQVQFHLNNIALAAPLLKHKLGGSAGGGHTGSGSAATASAAASTTTQARLLSQIPILRSVRKTRKKRKKVKPSEAAQLSAAEAQHQQQVLANLPPSKAFLYSCLSKAASKVPEGKDIVYNGTFPIDQPLCSRFKNLSFSLSSTDTELDGAGTGVPRGGGGLEKPASGEQILRKRNSATAGGTVGAAGVGKVVKTFAIDEPI